VELDVIAQPPKATPSWLWRVVVLTALIGLLWAFAVPNFVHSGPGKLTGIVNRLRQIDGAKQQWALEHGLTNDPQLNREITETDLAPYLHSTFSQRAFGDPQFGERYFIKRSNESPEALLTSKLQGRHGSNLSWPEGTIIRFSGTREEIVFPGQKSN
jgi:hypothetical protein